MKVNMTPNPLDVVTIHASQGDSEARQWEFELHNNGEKIDSSSITDRLVFKAYKGGTEQLLPENGSTPTTSPFKGDIKYPQGLLSDQEFTYRQSPTEEDGLAKITDIKGNTLVWNQLIQNGNFADTSNWLAESGATLSISNNIATISSTTVNNGIRQYFPIPLTVGHKYLIKAEFNVPTEYRCVIGTAGNQGAQVEKLISTANTWTEISGIGTCTVATTTFYCFAKGTAYENVKVRNIMFFDLTEMGLDITEPSEFTSLFPLCYYDFNQDSLLSFNGNGIKTVGFNQWDGETESGYIYNGITYASNDYWRTKNYIHVIPNETYYFNVPSTQGQIALYDANKVYVSSVNSMGGSSHLVTIPSGCYFARFYQPVSSDSSTVCVNISGDKNGTYEPYTSSTLSLPISTYFPNGMDGVGSDYDELTNTKASTRMARVDLGTLNWGIFNGASLFCADITGKKNASSSDVVDNIKCARYPTVTGTVAVTASTDKVIGASTRNGRIFINDLSYTSASDFKTSLSGVYLVYPLATPIETSITTASLVTENGEIPLSNEDGVLIGKCTEQLSENPGFIDAKIKLADADGECYSNKIQLHVERSPQ